MFEQQIHTNTYQKLVLLVTKTFPDQQIHKPTLKQVSGKTTTKSWFGNISGRLARANGFRLFDPRHLSCFCIYIFV